MFVFLNGLVSSSAIRSGAGDSIQHLLYIFPLLLLNNKNSLKNSGLDHSIDEGSGRMDLINCADLIIQPHSRDKSGMSILPPAPLLFPVKIRGLVRMNSNSGAPEWEGIFFLFVLCCWIDFGSIASPSNAVDICCCSHSLSLP